MGDLVFCPACLSKDKLSLVLPFRSKVECVQCGARFPANATLVSEDTVRVYVRQRNGEADHLLKELEKAGKDESWYRRQ